jgi:hypothetical protein
MISDAADVEISLPNDNPFVATPILGEQADLFQWTDVPTSFDFPQLLLSSVEPSDATSASLVRLQDNVSSEPPAGSFCAPDCSCPISGNYESNTTSCAVAYQMVLQYNAKRLDMVEIHIRLWKGFRAGKNGNKDCTVVNKVLFELLDYISN